MKLFRRAARTPAALPQEQLRVVWQAVSLLLEYPGAQTGEHLRLIRDSLPQLPARYADPLARFVDHAESLDLAQLQAEFVHTFDLSKRGCLYLTYSAYGDTRRRGVALVEFKQAYRRGGEEFDGDELGEELPDHLAVVLEFGATVDVQTSWNLLCNYRAGVEMLRISLQDSDSAWADVLTPLSLTLPDLGEDEAEAVARLIEQGPPEEEVGLDGYGMDPRQTPGADPSFSSIPANPSPTFLGETIPVGAAR